MTSPKLDGPDGLHTDSDIKGNPLAQTSKYGDIHRS